MSTPLLYLSHGAPPLADDRAGRPSWRRGPPPFEKPRSILVVSAHWEDAPTTLGSTTGAPLLHDFWGFPQHYYDVTYDAPSAPGLADDVTRLLGGAGPGASAVHRDETRGLDHGAYVPLKEMFPEADVPVLQVSMPTLDPRGLFAHGPAPRPAARAGDDDRRLRLHHAQPALVRPGGRTRRRGARGLGGVRPLGRGGDGEPVTSTACSTSSPRPPPRTRRTPAPSTSRRSSSPSAPPTPRAGSTTSRSSTASGSACPSAAGSSADPRPGRPARCPCRNSVLAPTVLRVWAPPPTDVRGPTPPDPVRGRHGGGAASGGTPPITAASERHGP